MKIYLYTLILLIGSLVSAQNKVTVGILSDVPLNGKTQLLIDLKEEIIAVVGQDADLIFKELLPNNHDVSLAEKNYNTLLENDTDIILAFGIVNIKLLIDNDTYPKPLILFGNVNSDFVKLPRSKTKSGINNLSFVLTPYSHKNDLDSFKTLIDYKKIGIIVDDFLPEIFNLDNEFDKLFNDEKTDYSIIKLSELLRDDFSFKNTDALYLSGGFFLSDSDFNSIITKINSARLPSFSAFGRDDVRKGVLASIQPENSKIIFFRRIALNIESIISGVNPSELPLRVDYVDRLVINFDTANEIDFPIRYSLLSKADIIGGTSNIYKGESLSIIEIMNTVVNKNLFLTTEKMNIDIANQEAKLAKSNFFPEIAISNTSTYIDPKIAEISNGSNPEFSNTGSVSLNQLIYSEEAASNNFIKNELKKAQNEQYNATELDALLSASSSYFNALGAIANARIQNQNLQLTKKNLELAEQNFAAGASGKSDVLRFRSQLAQNTQSLIVAGNSVKQSHYLINQLMNNKITQEIDLEDAVLGEGLFKKYSYAGFFNLIDNPNTQTNFINFLVKEALANSPELKNIGYNLNAVDRSYKLNNWGRLMPTFGVQGQYNLDFVRSGVGTQPPIGFPNIPDQNYNVGLQVTLPLFQKNQRNINKQTAEITTEQLSFQKQDIEQNINKNINEICLNVVNQFTNVEISKVSEKAAKESLDLTQTSYENGAVPVIQLIDAQNNFLQSQLASATANYSFLLSIMQLERSVGYFFLMHTEQENEDFINRMNQFVFTKK
jgi:outer membrane protein TolC